MTVEPISPSALHPVQREVFSQHWGNLAYLHWPVDPELVAPLLPPGTRPDVLDGQTWVGLVPFQMSGIRIFGTPPLPWLSSFPETNIRLYAVDGQGRRGVVFRSLEASRLLPVVAAKLTYHLPYLWSRMSITHDGLVRTYTCERRWPGPRGAGGTIKLRIGEAFEGDELAHFLTARWGLFSTWYGGRTVWAPVEHETWPLHRAELLELSDDLVLCAGLPAPTGAPHVMWSPGVRVRIGRPTVVR